MQLPQQLKRTNSHAYKNQFGHALILAGSKRMMGAAALTCLAAMRSGAGLITLGIPESLNSLAQKKISATVMTFPLKESLQQTLAGVAFSQIKKEVDSYQVITLGPGLSTHSNTQNLINKIISSFEIPLIIDADGLNAVALNPKVLLKTSSPKILTPHIGEMARLTGLKKSVIEKDREKITHNFAKKYQCVILLKGKDTIVASPEDIYINKTGNAGMATAGSGDILTGIITAFLAQGLSAFDATKWGAYFHGFAGDLAAKNLTQTAMIATDIIKFIPKTFKKLKA